VHGLELSHVSVFVCHMVHVHIEKCFSDQHSKHNAQEGCGQHTALFYSIGYTESAGEGALIQNWSFRASWSDFTSQFCHNAPATIARPYGDPQYLVQDRSSYVVPMGDSITVNFKSVYLKISQVNYRTLQGWAFGYCRSNCPFSHIPSVLCNGCRRFVVLKISQT